jgi:hypothetical protein
MGTKHKGGGGAITGLLIAGVVLIGGYFIFKQFVPGGFGTLGKVAAGLTPAEKEQGKLQERIKARNLFPITPTKSSYAFAERITMG